jgi:hypothetical protein
MTQWRAIERCLDEAGPFIYTATRTGPLRLCRSTDSRPTASGDLLPIDGATP